MKLYKKMIRLIGQYNLGQGFGVDERVFIDWTNEDDPTFEEKVQKIKKEYSGWPMFICEKYVEINK